MSQKSKLSEWREYIRNRKQQEQNKSHAECEKLADKMIEKLIEDPFDPKKDYHFITMLTKGCRRDDFYLIMDSRCRSVFGEPCDIQWKWFNEWRVGFNYKKEDPDKHKEYY